MPTGPVCSPVHPIHSEGGDININININLCAPLFHTSLPRRRDEEDEEASAAAAAARRKSAAARAAMPPPGGPVHPLAGVPASGGRTPVGNLTPLLGDKKVEAMYGIKKPAKGPK